jgi:hypothetical protein
MTVIINGTTGITTPGVTNTGTETVTTQVISPIVGAASGSTLSLQSNGTTNATLDTNGNLGLGVTPSSWSSSYKVLQIGSSFFGALSGTIPVVGSNTYSNGTSDIYATTGAASRYYQNGGVHYWNIAPSGTAGNAITFTQAMTLNNSGNLLVGTTSSIITSTERMSIQSASGSIGLAINASGSGSYGIGIYGSQASGATNQTMILFQNSSSATVGSIVSNGTATAYNITSDERLKNDFGVVTSTDVILNTKIHDVTYKADETQTHMLTVMAQEAVKVNPVAVTVGDDEVDENGNLKNPWQVDYSKYVPALIVEVQSLRARVAQLEAKGA